MKLTIQQIQKYKAKTISQLIKLATKHYNKFIRERDENEVCISCNNYTTLECGHFYSAGHYPAVRFNEDNTHGQCKRCNHFLSGNLNEYRINLIQRIGIEKVEKLDQDVNIYKRSGYKWDRFTLINIIEKYK